MKILKIIKDLFKHKCHFYFDKSQLDEDYLIEEEGVLKSKTVVYYYFVCNCGNSFKTNKGGYWNCKNLGRINHPY